MCFLCEIEISLFNLWLVRPYDLGNNDTKKSHGFGPKILLILARKAICKHSTSICHMFVFYQYPCLFCQNNNNSPKFFFSQILRVYVTTTCKLQSLLTLK